MRQYQETMTQAEFAALVNRKPGYISQLKSEGILVMTADGRRVLVRESLEAIEGSRNPAFAGVAARHEAERQAKLAMQQGRAARGPDYAHGDDDGDDDDADSGVMPDGDRSANQNQAAKKLFVVSRAKREHWAQLAAQLEFERRAGTLIYASDVAAAANAAAVQVRVSLEQMIDAVAPRVAASTNEAHVRGVLADELHTTLETLARSLDALSRSEK